MIKLALKYKTYYCQPPIYVLEMLLFRTSLSLGLPFYFRVHRFLLFWSDETIFDGWCTWCNPKITVTTDLKSFVICCCWNQSAKKCLYDIFERLLVLSKTEQTGGDTITKLHRMASIWHIITSLDIVFTAQSA